MSSGKSGRLYVCVDRSWARNDVCCLPNIPVRMTRSSDTKPSSSLVTKKSRDREINTGSKPGGRQYLAVVVGLLLLAWERMLG